MKILFLHGWTATPDGVKPGYLARHGHQVFAPLLPPDDFDASVRIAQEVVDREQPQVIVGMSRGAGVAMNVRAGAIPLVLLCPGWKRWGTVKTVKPGTIILHSPSDDIVPFATSEELVQQSGLPASALVATGVDHRLGDPESMAAMLAACESAAKLAT